MRISTGSGSGKARCDEAAMLSAVASGALPGSSASIASSTGGGGCGAGSGTVCPLSEARRHITTGTGWEVGEVGVSLEPAARPGQAPAVVEFKNGAGSGARGKPQRAMMGSNIK